MIALCKRSNYIHIHFQYTQVPAVARTDAAPAVTRTEAAPAVARTEADPAVARKEAAPAVACTEVGSMFMEVYVQFNFVICKDHISFTGIDLGP